MHLGAASVMRHGGRALIELGGEELTELSQTTNAVVERPGVRRRGLSFVVERETAQTIG